MPNWGPIGAAGPDSAPVPDRTTVWTVIEMRVHATKDTCAVASLCVYRVPQVFSQDEDGQVEVLDPNPPESLRPEVLSAARACPTRSIHVE